MKFDELDKKMRVYETVLDHCTTPDIYMVARIDGRNFTTLTKKKHNFKVPFDDVFRNYMVETTKHLMKCGFNIIYGYTQSDEISLLFDLNETAFGRKSRKYNSILAGETSGKFSILLGDVVSFDCRISELPNKEKVVDYFRWRNEDASRNSLNAYCYWTLRNDGKSIKEATEYFEGMSVSDKNEFLFNKGINFNNVPIWQRRGTGLYFEKYSEEAINQIQNKSVTIVKSRLKIDCELPMKEMYAEFILNILNYNNK